MMKTVFSQKYVTEIVLVSMLVVTTVSAWAGWLGSAEQSVLIGVCIIGMTPIYWNTFRALREKDWASMDMLAAVALTFSVFQREWFSVIFITLMLAVARVLAKLSADGTKASLESLRKLRSEWAKVENAEGLRTVSINELKKGDVVVVDVGERIPVDGAVLSGSATIDESSLTGESLPVEKFIGASVKSSTLVLEGSLHIRTETVGEETLIERIIALVQSAETEKPTIETFGQKFGKMYLIGMFLVSSLLLLVTRDVSFVLAVVLVVCADDIAVAIPLTYLRAIGSAARHGVVVKGARYLETLGKVDTIVFDKTGTLTAGKPELKGVAHGTFIEEEALIALGASVATRSSHPLSQALVRYAQEHGIEADPTLTEGEVLSGMGIEIQHNNEEILFGREELFMQRKISLSSEIQEQAKMFQKSGYSVSYVAVNRVLQGCFAFGDTVRAEAREAIEQLRSLGVKKMVMLSGDNEAAAEQVARDLGIDEWHGGLFPEDKVERLRVLTQEGVVAMLGDGVNDAAALSLAHVGVAMGGMGTDGAIESANIILMQDNLLAVPKAVRLARDTYGIAKQDFVIWGITNVFGLALVFGGLIGPAGAALYNFISDFFPLANSLRARVKQ